MTRCNLFIYYFQAAEIYFCPQVNTLSLVEYGSHYCPQHKLGPGICTCVGEHTVLPCVSLAICHPSLLLVFICSGYKHKGRRQTYYHSID